ncbi:hypothetical protein V6N12_057514 [Hibiscus sabdariffa]|uniref:Disease resistance protein At4g27190-like leucine-rich repeats domain-containing protein n=1 Tax=Hibiscus sabdariffa TaxID=183260 RepID=A0ABR2C5D4_9ROSI
MEGVIEGTLAAEEEEGISSSIKLFPKLDSLSLGGLPKLKRFGCAINPIEFPSLKSLNLQTCHALSTFTFDDDKSIVTPSHYLFDGKVNFPALEILDIRGMDNLERLWADQLVEHSFSKLTSIDLRDCPKLLNVFPLSMLTRLQRLERLEICNCESVEEIISEGGSSSSSNCGMPSLSSQFIQSFEFSNLTSLELYNLPNLKSIHHNKMHTMNWPSLKQMTVWKCHRVEMMFANSGETSSQQPLFWVNEVNFPVLEKLVIENMDNLERLWADQLVEHSFSKLTSINLEDCPKLVNVFPLSMLTRLQRLERLKIFRCESVEEIISEGGSSSNSSSGMPSLSPQFIQSFDFPNLTSLTLWELPNLKSIHHNKMLTMNWPSLKQMKVGECEKVEILFVNSGETSSQQPLFWVNESTFPNLHKLTLGWNAGIKDTKWHCNSQQQQHSVSHYFPNLKVVGFSEYPKQITVLPSYLSSFPNLQTLEISYSSFKELIFQSEEGGEEKHYLNSQITELRLVYLPELMHLWKEKEGFPNLRILHVEGCRGLQVNLVPSSVSVRNLVTLEVWHCDGIIKLITHSTAKSLVQLQQMTIGNCKNIEQVIQGGDDDDDDEISFPQLKNLELYDLRKLESFCSSDKYTFGFPSLQFLVVEKCPKMKMFSQGHSNTPMLHKVRLNTWSDEQRWEGNLNNTIQKVFREKNLKKEVENFVKDQDSYSTSKEDPNKPSTSNTQCMVVEN